MVEDRLDLVVIGAGPGGYAAAIRAAQLGMRVACIEKERAVGGTCLRVGCIPSKALLESSHHYALAREGLAVHGVRVEGVSLDLDAMMERKRTVVDTLCGGVDGLLKKNKIERIHGTASLAGDATVKVAAEDGNRTLSARNILIATGSRSAPLDGVVLDGDRIGDSTAALAWDAVPEQLVVIGAGYIGLELGSVWARLGAKVTVLEYLDRILPGMDDDLAKAAQKMLESQGLDFALGTRVTGATVTGDTCTVTRAEGGDIACDRVLLAVGRVPNTEGLDLEAAGVACDDRGRITVDETYRTTREGVYAIGDVIPGPMLAHKASEEGVACVEMLAGVAGHVNYDAIPGVCYTEPEIASVGATEQALKESGRDYRKGRFAFKASGRARCTGQTEGFVKVLADAATDRVLGVHILGAHAGELIAEAATAIEFGASSEDLARAVHAHPTLAEAIKEAALDVEDRAIHA